MASDKYLMLIGAPKCGTTSLAHWLGRHDNVFMPIEKEPGFFRSGEKRWIYNAHYMDEVKVEPPDSWAVSEDAYLALGADARPDQWIVDASTDYLWDPGAPERIKRFAERRTVKLLGVLRDPVDRAYSEYAHTRRDGLEPLSFRESIEREHERQAAGCQPLFFHITRSRYYEGLTRYRDQFGDDLILFSFKDVSDPSSIGPKIFDFLGIPHQDLGEVDRLNASKLDWRESFRRRVTGPIKDRVRRAFEFAGVAQQRRRVRQLPTPKLTDEDRAFVFSRLEDDIRRCVEDPAVPTDGWKSAAWARSPGEEAKAGSA